MKKLAIVMLVLAAACEGAPPPAGQNVEAVVQELKVPGALVGRGVPGGTYFQGYLFLTFTGTDGRINVMRRDSSGNWTQTVLPSISSFGAQIIEYNGHLFMAYLDQFKRFQSKTSSDGTNWTNLPETLLPLGANEPGLVVYQGWLIAYVPDDPPHGGSDGIYQFNFDTGSNSWFHHDTLEYAFTFDSPSAAVLGDRLVVSWVRDVGRKPRNRIFDPSTGWGGDFTYERAYRSHLITADTSPPSLLLLGSVSAGNIGPNELNFDSTTNGVDLNYLGHVGDISKHRPHGIRANGSLIELAYRGTNNGLYYRTVSLPIQ
jgi:hypothetical protein